MVNAFSVLRRPKKTIAMVLQPSIIAYAELPFWIKFVKQIFFLFKFVKVKQEELKYQKKNK